MTMSLSMSLCVFSERIAPTLAGTCMNDWSTSPICLTTLETKTSRSVCVSLDSIIIATCCVVIASCFRMSSFLWLNGESFAPVLDASFSIVHLTDERVLENDRAVFLSDDSEICCSPSSTRDLMLSTIDEHDKIISVTNSIDCDN